MKYWQTLRQAVGHEVLLLPSAASAVVRGDKLLLVRSTLSKTWHIPGRLHEPGESIKEMAQREIKEEIGLILEAYDLISVYSGSKWTSEYPNGDRVQQLLFFSKCRANLIVASFSYKKAKLASFAL